MLGTSAAQPGFRLRKNAIGFANSVVVDERSKRRFCLNPDLYRGEAHLICRVWL
jgi:hypothetical protein